jgi:NhaP-type Na+/H+ or K+/H+ antiporter
LHPTDKTRGGTFIAFCLFAGVVIKVTLKWFGLPFTVVLLFFGIASGMWEKYREQNEAEAVLAESMRKWAAIDPHVFLFIFLPALLYEASGSVDIHIFGRAGMQMLLLAGPGVIISTVLTATVVQEIFDYGWTWNEALCFGAMMSATDPVAVVALLGELGASKRLSLLIEGESLLNDGTAMVVFMVFEKAMGAGAPPLTGGTCVESFVQLAGGGVVLGWVVGQVTVLMLANIIDDPACEITLTLTAAYGGFFLAEGSAIGASGVLTVVIIGLTMSYSGTTALSPGVHHFMHEFWHMMGFLANTIIFILSGLIIVEKYHDESIRNYDWGLCFALWLALNLVRGFVVALMSPILVRLGYGLSFSQACVVVWGGLRGAVGLALAMIVEHDPAVSERVGQLFLFHMAGIVILTLLVNGSTTGMLVRYLKLHKTGTAARKNFENAAISMDSRISNSIEALKHNRFYSDADWALVWNTMPVFTAEVFEKRKSSVAGFNPKQSTIRKAVRAIDDAYFTAEEEREIGKKEVMEVAAMAKQTLEAQARGSKTGIKTSNKSKMTPELENDSGDSRAVMSASDVLHYAHCVVNSEDKLKAFQFQQHARHSYFNLVKANYWHQFETGFTSNNAHKALSDACNRAEDNALLHDVMRQQLDEWIWVEGFTDAPWLWTWLGSVPLLSYMADYYLEKQLEMAYDIANSFVLAHKTTTMQFIHSLEPQTGDGHDDHGHADAGDDGLMDENFVRSKLEHSTLSQDIKQVVYEILMDASYSMGRAQAFLDDLKMKHPQMAVSIATKSVCYALLQDLREHADHLSHHGELEDKEAMIVDKALLKTRKKLHFQNYKSQHGDGTVHSANGIGREILSMLPFFKLLPTHLQSQLARSAETRMHNRGQVLYHPGDAVDGIFVIVRGTVRVKASHSFIQRPGSPGSPVDDGEVDVLGSGETVGMLEVMYESSSRLVSAQCDSSVELLHIPASQLQQVLSSAQGGGVNEAAWRDAACAQVMLCRHSLPLFKHLNPQATRLLLANTHLYDHTDTRVLADGAVLPGRALLMRGMINDPTNGMVLERAVSMWEPTNHPTSSRVSFTPDCVLLVVGNTHTTNNGLHQDHHVDFDFGANSSSPSTQQMVSFENDSTSDGASQARSMASRRKSVIDASVLSSAMNQAAVSQALAGISPERPQHPAPSSDYGGGRGNGYGRLTNSQSLPPPPPLPQSQSRPVTDRTRVQAQSVKGPSPMIASVRRTTSRREGGSPVRPGGAKLRNLVKARAAFDPGHQSSYQSSYTRHDATRSPDRPTLDSLMSSRGLDHQEVNPTLTPGGNESSASREAPIRSVDLHRAMARSAEVSRSAEADVDGDEADVDDGRYHDPSRAGAALRF